MQKNINVWAHILIHRNKISKQIGFMENHFILKSSSGTDNKYNKNINSWQLKQRLEFGHNRFLIKCPASIIKYWDSGNKTKHSLWLGIHSDY